MENIKAKATNYVPESISFSEGYLYGLIKPDLGYIMMADWDKAKAIIEKLISDGRNIERVEMGAEAFLAKPIDQSELVAQIRAMLKVKQLNISRMDENKRLAELVVERTKELHSTHLATLNLLEDLRNEVESRKRTEADLRASEERLLRAEIAGKTGNWELDRTTGRMIVSKGAMSIYGIRLS